MIEAVACVVLPSSQRQRPGRFSIRARSASRSPARQATPAGAGHNAPPCHYLPLDAVVWGANCGLNSPRHCAPWSSPCGAKPKAVFHSCGSALCASQGHASPQGAVSIHRAGGSGFFAAYRAHCPALARLRPLRAYAGKTTPPLPTPTPYHPTDFDGAAFSWFRSSRSGALLETPGACKGLRERPARARRGVWALVGPRYSPAACLRAKRGLASAPSGAALAARCRSPPRRGQPCPQAHAERDGQPASHGAAQLCPLRTPLTGDHREFKKPFRYSGMIEGDDREPIFGEAPTRAEPAAHQDRAARGGAAHDAQGAQTTGANAEAERSLPGQGKSFGWWDAKCEARHERLKAAGFPWMAWDIVDGAPVDVLGNPIPADATPESQLTAIGERVFPESEPGC